MCWPLADGHLNRNRIGSETVFNFAENAVEVGSFAIKFVDKSESWHAVAIGLSPNGFALCFNAFTCAEYDDGTIEDAKTAFDFGGEVDVSWRVEQVDVNVFPVKRHAGGVDGDATVLFFGIVVGRGIATIDLAHAMFGAGEKQHSLGNGRLTSVDVRNDANVSKALKFPGHDRTDLPVRDGFSRVECCW